MPIGRSGSRLRLIRREIDRRFGSMPKAAAACAGSRNKRDQGNPHRWRPCI